MTDESRMPATGRETRSRLPQHRPSHCDDADEERQTVEIGIHVETILLQFWREDTNAAIRAMEITHWIDALDGCTADEVATAWRDYQRSGPRSAAGRLARPDAGVLYRNVMAARAATAQRLRAIEMSKRKPAPPEPEINRVTAEEADNIIREVGFNIRRFPAIGEGKE